MLHGTNQWLLWNPNDHSSVEGGSTVAEGENGGWTMTITDGGGSIRGQQTRMLHCW